MSNIGFKVQRTITIAEYFASVALVEALETAATVEMLGASNKVRVRIYEHDDSRLPGAPQTDLERINKNPLTPEQKIRENARQWMALCDLATLQSQDLKNYSENAPRVISLPAGRQTAAQLWEDTQAKLPNYSIQEQNGGCWQARSNR